MLEVIGGMLVLLVPLHSINDIVIILTAHELETEPNEWFPNAIRHAVAHLSSDTKSFASVYLIGHGCIKIFLVMALWQERRWAFPVALWFIGVFVVYQLYRFSRTHSPALLLFALVDVCVAWLIWREYRAQFK